MMLVSRPTNQYNEAREKKWVGHIDYTGSLLYKHANKSDNWKTILNWWAVNCYNVNKRIVIECPEK